MVYEWKEGSRFKADPELVADELNSLESKTPEAVLSYAENEGTELHKCLTWDDKKAAHLFRLDEVRAVIRSVVIVEEEEEVTYRAFEYVTIGDETKHREYMQTKEALNDQDYRDQIMQEISSSIGELARKAKIYEYLSKDKMKAVQKHLNFAKEVMKN